MNRDEDIPVVLGHLLEPDSVSNHIDISINFSFVGEGV